MPRLSLNKNDMCMENGVYNVFPGS